MKYLLFFFFITFNIFSAEFVDEMEFYVVKDVFVSKEEGSSDSDFINKAENKAINALKNEFDIDSIKINSSKFVKKNTENPENVCFDVYFKKSLVKKAVNDEKNKQNNVYSGKVLVKINVHDLKKIDFFLNKAKELDGFQIDEISENIISVHFNSSAEYIYKFFDEDFNVKIKNDIININL